MPYAVRLVFTIGAIGFLIAFLIGVDRGDRGADDSRFWRGGQGDVFRSLVMRPDGTLRRYTKLLVSVWLAIFVGVLWLLP